MLEAIHDLDYFPQAPPRIDTDQVFRSAAAGPGGRMLGIREFPQWRTGSSA
jgi:hypothetical protein